MPPRKKVYRPKGTFRRGIELTLWAATLPHLPTTTEIRRKFGVCRATAYRWRDDWIAEGGPTHQPHRLAATGSASTTDPETNP